ncbi:MAG: DUF192 domain-containing protein [Bacillota bacterium]
MIVKNESRITILANNLTIADSFLKRFLGLMFKSDLPKGSGLLIKPCNSIHMFFMKFSLDVVFIDDQNNVIHQIEGIKPWKCSKIIWNSHAVLELPAGTIKETGTRIGDRLSIY